MKNFLIIPVFFSIFYFSIALCQTAEELISQLQPWDVGNNSAAQTNLRKITRTVMTPPIDEAARSAYEEDLIAGLSSSSDENVHTVIITELGLIGNEKTVSTLKPYLIDSMLSDPSAMAIYQICRQTGWDVCGVQTEIKLLDNKLPNLKVSLLNDLIIQLPVSSNEYTILISDIQGRTIWSYTGIRTEAHKIPIEQFQAGIYNITLQSHFGKKTTKIAMF